MSCFLNSYCTTVLLSVLQGCQEAATDLRPAAVHAELAKIESVYSMLGFPVNVNYTVPEKVGRKCVSCAIKSFFFVTD